MKISAFFICQPFIVFAVIGLLAGCSESPPDTHLPAMTFANVKPIELDVAAIEIHDDYKPPMQPPHVEHNFPQPPYIAAENLLRKQLVAAGNENILRAIIQDASVVSEELPLPTGGVSGIISMVKPEPAERLDAKLLLRFELYSPSAPDIILGHVGVTVTRTKTLQQGATLEERQRAYFALTEDLMNDLNDRLSIVLQNSFGKKIL